MAPKRDLYERVDEAVAAGKLWRAKEILQGNIATHGYDTKLFERYGQVLMDMGDLVEAGKYLFVSGERQPEYEEAIGLYLGRFARAGPHHLLATFPRVARLSSLDGYPPAVREVLAGLKIGDRALGQAAGAGRGSDTVSCVGCTVLVVAAGVCSAIGLYTVIRWIVEGWR